MLRDATSVQMCATSAEGCDVWQRQTDHQAYKAAVERHFPADAPPVLRADLQQLSRLLDLDLKLGANMRNVKPLVVSKSQQLAML